MLCKSNEIIACIGDLFNSFVNAVAFFKVVYSNKLQVKWEIQLCVGGQIISVYDSEKIMKIGQHRNLCSDEKGPVF